MFAALVLYIVQSVYKSVKQSDQDMEVLCFLSCNYVNTYIIIIDKNKWKVWKWNYLISRNVIISINFRIWLYLLIVLRTFLSHIKKRIVQRYTIFIYFNCIFSQYKWSHLCESNRHEMITQTLKHDLGCLHSMFIVYFLSFTKGFHLRECILYLNNIAIHSI